MVAGADRSIIVGFLAGGLMPSIAVLADWDVTSVTTDAAAAAVWEGERRRAVSPRGLLLLGLGRG